MPLRSAAIRYLQAHRLRQPGLEELATQLGLSGAHLQRVFADWAGVSPKRFLQYLTKQHARELLRANADVFATALESGLSGAGRLHDLMVSCEALSPGEVRAQGGGVTIRHACADSVFGHFLVGSTDRGICHLAFHVDDMSDAMAVAANRIALLIPCHRVIRESGEIGEYRWQSERKLALIAREQAGA
ncbi:MAG: hypothetical protein CGU28_07590 [Candidatus Dactylopiibacterium carminicum]|nr:MAG: hypothetical protein CGU28_07590 [Candidatus Dactylopiibacterium carminicum]